MKQQPVILTFFLTLLYVLILGHNLLPHAHHPPSAQHQETHHHHAEDSLLDKLLGHHEHSSDFGDDLVDDFRPTSDTELAVFALATNAINFSFGQIITEYKALPAKVVFTTPPQPTTSRRCLNTPLRGPPLG